ncbi:MAG TPA: glycosyltransferase [Thermoleophilaceae bacterium]|nr:glycosyltransferase [Thermoleophilaceae bacterium]
MAVAARPLGDYAPAAGAEALERLRAAAEPLEGARVAHVSAAGTGGRVPELLGALLPLATDLGLRVEWRVLFGGEQLKAGVSALQNGMQGAETALDLESWSAYLEQCDAAAQALAGAFDAVVLHDPGALGLTPALDGTAVWRCHVDASAPEPDTLDRAAELAGRCDAFLFPHESFAPDQLRGERLMEAAPGIDPLSPRNIELEPRLVGRLVRPLGVDLSRPFCFQSMRLDRWKDPHATIEAFALAKQELPELQLALASALDEAVTEEWSAAKEVSDYADAREDIHLLSSYDRVGDLELGSLQRLARLTLHRAIREGFGLGASEALWKGTPVVGGAEGGLPLQVRDGVDGYLAGTAEETAARVVELVRDPGLAVEMGRAGRERVRERFLVTRMLEDELGALASVLGAGTVGRP